MYLFSPSLYQIKAIESGAIRIVFDRCDATGNAVLVALEIDDSVASLVTSAAAPHRHAPAIVSAAGLGKRFGQFLFWSVGCDLGKRIDGLEALRRA